MHLRTGNYVAGELSLSFINAKWSLLLAPFLCIYDIWSCQYIEGLRGRFFEQRKSQSDEKRVSAALRMARAELTL